MYIDIVPNRNSPPAVLLRESYREGGKVKKRTLANLSHLAPERHAARKGEVPVLYLYDVTSSYLEGERNESADWGYNRDGKKGKKQIVIGLLADAEGEPLAVRVFRGNTADPAGLTEPIEALRDRKIGTGP